MDAPAVIHETAADQVSREIKNLAAELAVVQEARAQGNAKTKQVDGSCIQPGIMTKPLQGEMPVFKRGRLLGLKITLPAKSGADAVPVAQAGETRLKDARPRRKLPGSIPGTCGRALKGLQIANNLDFQYRRRP